MTAANLVEQLRRRADSRPTACALAAGDMRLSFAGLLASAQALAVLLEKEGVLAGSRVALRMSNTPEWAVGYFGVMLAGAIAVPLNPRHDWPITAARLAHSGAEMVLADSSVPAGMLEVDEGRTVPVRGVSIFSGPVAAPSVSAGVVCESATPALISYGTRDPYEPSAVVLSHGALASAATAAASAEVLHLGPDDVVLAGIPMLTVPGQTYCLNAGVVSGAQLLVPEDLEVQRTLRTIAERRVSVLATVPLMMPALLRAARQFGPDLRTLRSILLAGGSPLSERVRSAASETFGCDLLECYGPPEFSSLACVTGVEGQHVEGSVGRCLESLDISVADEDPRTQVGELLLRGDHAMLGYWNDPEPTERALRDGWLHTGVGARLGEDGYVHVIEGGWMNRLAPAGGSRRGRPRLWRTKR